MPDPTEPLIPLAEYRPPSEAAEAAVRGLAARAAKLLRRRKEAPFVEAEDLRPSTGGVLDEVVSPPACGPFLSDLDAAFEDWLADADALHRLRVVVLPPCDRRCRLTQWAQTRGVEVLPPPGRDRLDHVARLPEGGGPLAVPRLERWFLRRSHGLTAVRSLMEAVAEADRKVIVGCGSWAWGFLCAAAEADLLLPPPRTSRPFDGGRLKAWFAELAEDAPLRGVRFRSSRTGKTVLSTDAEEDPAAGGYFQSLAARSNGVPWVAWHLWRRSLRTRAGEAAAQKEAEKDGKPFERTLWVAEPEDGLLPERGRREGLLALHALLIHDGLSVEGLGEVAPDVPAAAVAAALTRAGFVVREGGLLRVRPSAYPAVRSELASGGLPVPPV